MKRIKICWVLVLLTIILFNCLGCQDDSAVPTSANPKTNTEDSANDDTNINNDSEMNLESFLYAEESKFQKAFGKPEEILESEGGTEYVYESFSFGTDGWVNSGAHVDSICLYGTGAKMFGVEVGALTPKEVRSGWGDPVKEENVDGGFRMEYRSADNTQSCIFLFSSFRGTLTKFWVVDLMSGVELPMDLTVEEMKNLIVGYWIPEEQLYETNLEDIAIQISANRIYAGLGDFSYEITAPNILIYKVRNSITTDYDDNVWFLDFYEDGERMEMYKLDNIGDKDPNFHNIYYRYK